jgi:hypothetical protein
MSPIVYAFCCCVQACPHSSVQFRLRLPGVDLWTSHKPLAAELALQFILLGAGARKQPLWTRARQPWALLLSHAGP